MGVLASTWENRQSLRIVSSLPRNRADDSTEKYGCAPSFRTAYSASKNRASFRMHTASIATGHRILPHMLRAASRDSKGRSARLTISATVLCVFLAGCQCSVPASYRQACGRGSPTPAMILTDQNIDDAASAPIPEPSYDESEEVVQTLGTPPDSPKSSDIATDAESISGETTPPVVREGPADVVSAVNSQTTNPCGWEHDGPCDEDICGHVLEMPEWRFPRLRMPRFRFPIWCGPLFHRGAETGPVEEELRPPHSRFHPVPTQPVFEPRLEYAIPELMMTEAKKPGVMQRPFVDGPLGSDVLGPRKWRGRVLAEEDPGNPEVLREPRPPEYH
jgi:hypothetical protein